jgi:hypothetical protein
LRPNMKNTDTSVPFETKLKKKEERICC